MPYALTKQEFAFINKQKMIMVFRKINMLYSREDLYSREEKYIRPL